MERFLDFIVPTRRHVAWENGQEYTMSIFARRMTFFSFYQSEHKNFHENGLYIGKVSFFGPEKS